MLPAFTIGSLRSALTAITRFCLRNALACYGNSFFGGALHLLYLLVVMLLLRCNRCCGIFCITDMTRAAGCIALLLRYRKPYADPAMFQILTCTFMVLIAGAGYIYRLIISLTESTSLEEKQEEKQYRYSEYIIVRPHIISFTE